MTRYPFFIWLYVHNSMKNNLLPYFSQPNMSFILTSLCVASKHFSLFFILIMSSLVILSHGSITAADNATTTIGAIIDADSRAGKEEKTAMTIAVDKFNSLSNYHKLAIHFQNSNGDPLQAASSDPKGAKSEQLEKVITLVFTLLSDHKKEGVTKGILVKYRILLDSNHLVCLAADELVKEKQVGVIVGTHTWEEAAFVANIGRKSQVPVVSFSAADFKVPLAWNGRPFFVQMATSNSEEISCIAAMVGSYNWRTVIVINEDNDYGTESHYLVPLAEALHNVDSVIEHHVVLPTPSSSFDEEISEILHKNSRVFIVLQSSLPVATRLFKEAKQHGLMGRDTVWILTKSVSSLLDSTKNSAFNMQGALGIKTYYRVDTEPFRDFRARFIELFKSHHPEEDKFEPGIHALRAYDSIVAVFKAVESLGSDSASGTKVLDNIVSSNFSGLSGGIRFHNGRLLDSPLFEIINVVGKSYKEVGFWSSKSGFCNGVGKASVGQSMKSLTALVNWPGDLNRDPKGWKMPSKRNKMKIGVPGKTSFEKFVKVTRNASTNVMTYTGFCIDVFKMALVILEKEQGYTLPYEFLSHSGTYDSLVDKVYNKTYDAVIGDVTILANRSKYVAFTKPFIESGLSMFVPVKSEPQKRWTFVRPFSKGMWLASFGILFYTMFVVWFIEHQTNQKFRGPLKDQLGTALWFTCSSLFFAHREKIQSNYSKVVVLNWLLVVLILTSSYTASLTSMLTVPMLEPTVTNIEWIRRSNSAVGCDPDSFVWKYLKEVLQLPNVQNISAQEAYPDNFNNRSIKAAFLELPYLKVFLKEQCNKYISTGPNYRFGGQGFVFTKGSPIADDVSEAILTMLESGELHKLETKWFGSSNNCSDPDSGMGKSARSLGVDSFSGIYMISFVTSTACFFLVLLPLIPKQLKKMCLQPGINSNQSRWNKVFKLLSVGLHRGVVAPSKDEEWNCSTSKWESVSTLEIISTRADDIEIPIRMSPSQNEYYS